MKYLYLLSFLLIYGCNQKAPNIISKEGLKIEKITYSKEYLHSLLDSLEHTDETLYEDYTSPISRKILSIGKPMIPILMERMNDDTPTKTYHLSLIYRNWNTNPYFSIGDFSRQYIYRIYEDLDEKKPSYLLSSSEYDMINRIIPNIQNDYEKDSIESLGQSSYMSIYDFFIHNPKYKMDRKERRDRYKEEFINNINKDLLK